MIEAPYSTEDHLAAVADGAGQPNRANTSSRTPLQRGIIAGLATLAAVLLAWAVYAVANNLREQEEASALVGPTMELVNDGGGSCLTRGDDGSICFNLIDGQVYLEAFGLKPGSMLEISSSAGSVEFDVEPDGMVNVEVGGKLVDESFRASGTWADGEVANLNLDIAG